VEGGEGEVTKNAIAEIEAPADSHVFLASDFFFMDERKKSKDVVTLTIARLKGHTPSAKGAKVKGVKVTLWECDYDDQDELDEKNTLPIAELALDLVPNKALADDPEAPHWAVGSYDLVKAYHRFKYSTSTGSAKQREETAHFYLYLGGEGKKAIYIPLRVPPGTNFHDEGDRYEIGLTVEHKSLPEKLDLRDFHLTACVLVLAPDTIQFVRSMSTRPRGYIKNVLPKGTTMGRFNAPGRNPRVEPDVAHDTLEQRVEEALAGADPVDLDGVAFSRFVDPKKRRRFIEHLHAKRLPLSQGGEVNHRFKHGDIDKAWFVIHEIASGLTGKTPPTYKFDKKRADTHSVCGWINANGTFAVDHDMDGGKSGTVYGWMEGMGGAWCSGYLIGVETVAITLEDPLPQEQVTVEAYPTWGWGNSKKKVNTGKKDENGKPIKKEVDVEPAYFYYTKALMDALVELYVFASARANNLLTVTLHIETDRSLMYSGAFHELSASRLRELSQSGGEVMQKLLKSPGDPHGDPYGFDPQALYDMITRRLIELSTSAEWGPPEPLLTAAHSERKLRYGVNPARVRNPATKVTKNGIDYVRNFGNTGDDLHTFPWQSAGPEEFLGKNGGRKEKYWWKTK
jgi:hypothetical protein